MGTRRNVYLTKQQIDFLSNLEGVSVSEHIRRAIDKYIEKKQRAHLATTLSPSIRKYE